MIFSGVFERHPRLTLAIVEFELAWAPNILASMDYTYRERHGESLYRLRKILAQILKGVPDDEQAKIAGGNTARVYKFDVARLTAAR